MLLIKTSNIWFCNYGNITDGMYISRELLGKFQGCEQYKPLSNTKDFSSHSSYEVNGVEKTMCYSYIYSGFMFGVICRVSWKFSSIQIKNYGAANIKTTCIKLIIFMNINYWLNMLFATIFFFFLVSYKYLLWKGILLKVLSDIKCDISSSENSYLDLLSCERLISSVRLNPYRCISNKIY